MRTGSYYDSPGIRVQRANLMRSFVIWPRGISLRLFFVILVLLVGLAWQFVVRGGQYMEASTRRAVEMTLLDTARLLAAQLTLDYTQQATLDTTRLHTQFMLMQQDSAVKAQQNINISICVINAHGAIIYHSAQLPSATQVIADSNHCCPAEQSTHHAQLLSASQRMFKHVTVCVPIQVKHKIIGNIAIAGIYRADDASQPGNVLAWRRLVFVYFILAFIVLVLLAWWLARALRRISIYAEAMAANHPAQQPQFADVYLRRLADAVGNLRGELNGRQTVEHYVHGLTHELKTPMTSIRAAAELLDEPDLVKNEQQQLIAQIQRANSRMQVLVERLLQLARLENHAPLVASETILLIEIIKEILKENKWRLNTKHLKTDSSKVGNITVKGDKMLIMQAVSAVLDNALDFSQDGSVILIAAEKTNQQIALSIHNCGPSIPEYALPRLCERFFSLPRPGGKPRSSGLGLSFAAQIMTLHGGEIRVINAGNGVRATLIWPDR